METPEGPSTTHLRSLTITGLGSGTRDLKYWVLETLWDASEIARAV